MRIHIVAPITTPGLSRVEDFTDYAAPGTEVTVSILQEGPASIESQFDEAIAVPEVLRGVLDAQESGADAVIIDCMGDPGLGAAREIARIPVFGPGQTSMHVAALMALNFSILTTGASVEGIFHDLVRRYGMTDQVNSIRTVDVPVLELGAEELLRERLQRQAELAHDEDGAHAIILGCTGMRGWARMLQDHLAATGRTPIPVIDPIAATFSVAQALAGIGLAPSVRSYPSPPRKPGAGFEELLAVMGR